MTAAHPDHTITLLVAKGGELAWLGHLDLARSIERALRRAEFPLRFTEGFHKRTKMRLPEPLPLGVGSEAERYVVHFAAHVDASEVTARLAGRLPRGVEVLAALAGSHPERKDAPLTLELEAEVEAALQAAISGLPTPLPTLSGAWSVVHPVTPMPAGGAIARVLLEAPVGGRVSVGRFLEALRAAVPGGLALRAVTRRVAWQADLASLRSPARFVPDSPGEAGIRRE